jgi:hypothetical protein
MRVTLKLLPRDQFAIENHTKVRHRKALPFLLNAMIVVKKATGVVVNGHSRSMTEFDKALSCGLMNPSRATSI